jgi:signal transduction histidine kinase/CheY-like chemotaxis protein
VPDFTLLQHLPLAAIVVDQDRLSILAANEAAVRNYGYSRQEFLALTLGDICPELIDAIGETDGRRPPVLRHRVKNGTLLEVEAFWREVLTDHGPVFIGLLHDISQSGVETNGGGVQSHAKDEFLATLSHELRTPLNAILGWTQTLQSGNTRKETLLRALSQIEESAQAQAKLIDDLLNVSDIIAGRLRLEVQPMRLTPVIKGAIETLYPAIDAKEIHLETSFDPAADVVSGDPARMRQIVWNLLSNAVKFTPRTGRVGVRLDRGVASAEMAVFDSGEGISAEFLPHVFDRFRQGDASSRKRHGGLGLGLTIVRHLVEMHGGTVEAQSGGKGLGSTFTVRLPIRATWEERRRTSRSEHSSAALRASRHRLTGVRILTVDDDRNTREMLQEALERAGARVQSASSAKDALEKLKRFRPDVLVSDIGMPEEDGYDLMRQVRILPVEQGGATPAIALTGYAHEEDQAATRAAGYQAVTAKPVNLDELLSTIASVAERT